MDRVDEFIHSFLEENGDILVHYASEYYDPAKAREYYLKTRELKGRQSGANLKTKAKKQAWNFAKKNIKDAQKKEVATGAFLKADFVKKTQAMAKAKRKEWAKMLESALGDKGLAGEKKQWTEKHAAQKKAALDKVSAQAKTEIARIKKDAQEKLASIHAKIEQASADASKQIAALPPIPKGITKERRAELAADRAKEIAKIRGEADKTKTSLGDEADAVRTQASSARKDVSKWASNERKSITDNASREQKAFSEKITSAAKGERESVRKKQEAVAGELKATVAKARSDYEALKETLKAKYEKASNVEYEAIRRQV